MSDIDRTATKRVPMDSLRKTSLAAGILYLITFISIPTLALYAQVKGVNYIVGSGPDTRMLIGGLLEMIIALAGIGTAVALYPVLKRQNEGMALGFAAVRTLEAATIFVGVASLLAIVTLRQSGAGAGALATGRALVGAYDAMFLIGQSTMPAVSAVLLGYLLYKSRLVPRVLPVLAFISAPLLLVSMAARVWSIGGTPNKLWLIAGIPIAVWELSLGLYLTFKGFRPSPITAEGFVPNPLTARPAAIAAAASAPRMTVPSLPGGCSDPAVCPA
jgi:hypothetical protein